MKVKEILSIINLINHLEQREQNQDSKDFGKLLHTTEEYLKPYKYCFLKNKLKFKSIVEENSEIIKLINSEYEGEEKDLENFILNDKRYIDFNEEEKDLEWYTIKLEIFEEEKDFDQGLVEFLLGKLITE